MGRALSVLGDFRPFGRTTEEALQNESYFLFDPTIARSTGSNAVEQAVMSSSCNHHEEEIYIKDNVVVWSSGQLVRKRFSSPSPVLKVCWCCMESVSEPLLCILHPNSLTTQTLSGEAHSVPFPHSMSSMWPTPWGLIMKRAAEDPYRSLNAVPPISSSILKLPKAKLSVALRRASVSPPESAGAVYFTLSHPLEEPEALHFEDHSGRMRIMMDSADQIVWSSDKIPYIVSYHKGRKQHALWELKYFRHPQDHQSRCPGFYYLQHRWQETGEQSQATKVFMTTDAEEKTEPLICFVEREAKKLFTLRITNDSTIMLAWTISAVSAVPIVGSQFKKGVSQLYLVVLAPDGNMYLYVGRYPLCTLTIPLLTNEKEHVEELFDAVNTNFSVLTSSRKVYRCSLNLTPSSGITRSCLSALAEGLRPIFYRYILSSYLDNYDCKSVDSNKTGREDKEWSTFSGVIMQFIEKPKAMSRQHSSRSGWDLMLQSSRHKNASLLYPCLRIQEKEKELSVNENKKTGYASMLLEILEILHMVYEDYKLDTLRWGQLPKLALLLNTIAVSIEEYDYVDHYVGDFPVVVPSQVQSSNPKQSVAVLNHYIWIENALRKSPRSNLPTLITSECSTSISWSRKVLGFFELLLNSGADARGLPSGIRLSVAEGTAKTAEQRTVLAMVGEHFGLSHLDRLPCGISLPLRHALNTCRESPPSDWPSDAYILLGREDLAYMSASRASSDRKLGRDITMAAPYMLQLRPTLSSNEREGADARPTGEGLTGDGMEHMFTPTATLRFGSDLRLNEVRRVLCSSRHVAVRTSNAPDISDPDLVAQQQAQLWQLAQRTTALPFGRGAFTLSTLRPLLTETLQIPKLVLAGRLPSQHDAIVNLDVNAGNINDLTTWPEFHNGVAAGLRLAPGQAKITRTWIVYNKPDEPSYEHAGFLMSLGLHKHLAVLAATDVYRYLSQEHDPTTVGILLGMAAAHRGTMDAATSKMLYLHIPARHPPSFPEIELSSSLQSAALMAVGLLYQGSAHRLTTEILLAEIGRKPGSDSSLDREGYALAAGFALGLVTLGRGKDAWGLTDLKIEDRLLHYMCGGSEQVEEYCRKVDGTSASVARNHDDVNQTGGQVLEGSIVNLDVTAPGATLALALMFMKTNDHGMAARLSIPDTHFALEYVRPDFILLRVIARSVILWDSVQATEDWVQSQIPVNVRQRCGSDPIEAAFDADFEALAQAHVNILAGACLSIGLKYAGTASSEAQHLLYHYALYFLKEKSASASASNSSPNRKRVDKGTLETCLNIAVLSLSVVMAGTGHLGTFKLLRYLRRRNDADIVYGNHMAISMAIGFLFLGGGYMTFSTNNAAIAALLISLYPRFPTAPNDHRCHLQAFRHLYVLAAEARCVQTIDVDTGMLVYAPLEMTLRETNLHCKTSYSRVTPCILPERSSLQRVRVCGPRYWSQDIQLGTPVSKRWWEQGEEGDPFNSGVLYVKRKVGARSYADDPIGSRSLLSRVLQRVTQMNAENVTSDLSLLRDQSKVDELVGTFSSDPSLLAFAQQFCSHDLRGDFQEFCLLALFECVSMDKPALLQAYVELYTSVESLINRAMGRGSSMRGVLHICLSLQNLKVALAYCEAAGHDPIAALKGQSLIQRTFLASLAKRIDEVLMQWRFQGLDGETQQPDPAHTLVCYFTSHSWPRDSDGNKGGLQKLMFACYKCWDVLPPPGLVKAAVQELHQAIPDWQSKDIKMLLPVLASLIPGTPARTLLMVAECLPLLVLSTMAVSNNSAGVFSNKNLSIVTTTSTAGSRHLKLLPQGKFRTASPSPHAIAATVSVESDARRTKRATWSEFEIGKCPVWWQASDGRAPTAGGQLMIFFNPDASEVKPNDVYGMAFTGGFNQPVMCGGEPRVMAKKDRGKACAPIFSIKINLPKHALSLEFSFTNGKDWDGPYKINLLVPPKLKNKPMQFFKDGLAAELSAEGACEQTIFPESLKVIDRCPLPAYNPEGWKCDLDINPGCTDEENPFYDPLANVDDGSCPFVAE